MSEKAPPDYAELVNALVGMACQFLAEPGGTLDDYAVSGGQQAIDVLTRLGLVVNGKLTDEAFDPEFYDRLRAST